MIRSTKNEHEQRRIELVETWEEFLKNVNKDTKLPGHPIWADCFQGQEKLPGDLRYILPQNCWILASFGKVIVG